MLYCEIMLYFTLMHCTNASTSVDAKTDTDTTASDDTDTGTVLYSTRKEKTLLHNAILFYAMLSIHYTIHYATVHCTALHRTTLILRHCATQCLCLCTQYACICTHTCT